MTPEQARLAAAYLASDDPLRQSGFSGGRDRWERLRRPVADAVDRSGSFLDIGCANGALLDDVVSWCAERRVQVDPWGLDVSPEPVYVDAPARPAFVRRLREDVVAPGGRLLVCSYSPSGAAPLPGVDQELAAQLTAWGLPPVAVLPGIDADGTVRTAVAVLRNR